MQIRNYKLQKSMLAKIFLGAAALAAGAMMLVSVASAADVLDIGYGAKSIALGKTYTSVKADAYGIFGNPASLKGVTTGEIVSMYGQMSTDISYTMLGYVMPTKYGKFFVGYGNNQMTGFTSTTLDATTGRPAAASDFDYRSDLLMLGYENSLTRAISYGLRLKYMSKGAGSIAGYYASGMNADASVLVEANDRLTLGVTAKNIVPGTAGALNLGNGQTEDQVFAVDMGLGFKAHPKLSLYTDVAMTKNIPAELKVGIEWKPINMLAVRLGGEQKSAGGNSSYLNGSAGVGLDIGVFGIDYAYYYDSVLTTNSRHFISISMQTPNVTAAEPQFAVSSTQTAVSSQETAVSRLSNVIKQEAKSIEYIVKEGDCLSKIAEKLTGHWRLCYKIAKDSNIKNPDLIFPGQKITIK